MIHLLPLKEQEGRSLQELLQHAQKEANFLIEGGVDAICLINESDKPRDITIGEYEKERFTKIAVELRQITDIPLGICVLYNDRKATFEIAKTSHADFVRIDTFIDDVMSDAGVITAYPEKIIAMKDELCSDIQLFVDIHPKYKNLISYRPLEESVKEAFTYPID